MITIEDKLDIFYKLVFKNEQENAKVRLGDVEKEHKDILEDKILELEKIKQQTIDRKRSLAQIQKNEMISKAIGEDKHKLLIKREELLKDLINSLHIRAIEFTKTAQYRQYMLKKVKYALGLLDEKDIIINLKKEDKERFQNDLLQMSIKDGKNVYFDLLTGDTIGGFIITDKERSYSLDNTFKTIINQNRYKIGKELYIALEKTGDLNE